MNKDHYRIILVVLLTSYPIIELSRIIIDFIIIQDLEFYNEYGWSVVFNPSSECLLYVELIFMWIGYSIAMYYVYKWMKS